MQVSLNPHNLPEHVAIIMDGNGRWGKQQGRSRTYGHRYAVKRIREVVSACCDLAIPYLTLYAFSIENWRRPRTEVESLMRLIVTAVDQELATLVQNNVKLNFIGDLLRLPLACREAVHKAQEASYHNQGLYLTIALSYSGQWDLVAAVKAIASAVQAGNMALQDVDTACLKQHLVTKDIPDPSLLIRTGGEMRLSNFFLAQLAYTELFFTPVYWPDFSRHHFYEALQAYQKRERRFGSVTPI